MAKVIAERLPDLVPVLVTVMLTVMLTVMIGKIMENQPAIRDEHHCAFDHGTGNHRKLAIIVG